MGARVLVVAVLCLLGLARPAAAATFQLTDKGRAPDVAIAEDGAGHFVWNEPGSGSSVPDTTRYCRVPAGQTICDAFVGLVPSENGIDSLGRSPRVFLPAAGQVLVLTGRNEMTYAFRSTDGGATFDKGRAIGRLPYEKIEDAALGPGDHVSLAYGDGRYQAASLSSAGPTESFADVSDAPGHPDSVTLINPSTPMLALDVDGPSGRLIQVSRYKGSGDLNSASSWTAPATVGRGEAPVLRTGPSGTFLYYVSRDGDEPRYVLRRLEGDGFGPPTTVQSSGGFPRFGDLAVDPAGGLHTTWVQAQDAVRYRSAPDGRTLGPAVELLRSETTDYNIRLAANSAHAGFLVADSNGTGVVTATPFSPESTKPPPPPPPGGGEPPPDGPGPACRTAGFGIVEAKVASGCFAKEGSRFVAANLPVRINGIDLKPVGSGRIVIDPEGRTVTSTGVVATTVGGVPIDVGKVAWNVPKDQPRVNLGSFEGEEKGKSSDFFGFPIKGSAKVELLDKRSEVLMHVGLPSLFKGLTGDVTLRADNVVGLRFDGLEIRAPHAQLGPLEIKDLVIRYMVGGNFSGSGIIILPPNPPGATLTASFSFINAAFAHAEGDFKPVSPVPVASGVFMTHLGFGLFVQPPPTKITGQIGLIGGPQVAGKAALTLEGEAFYKFPSPPKPAHLHIGAKANVAGFIDMGEANFDYFSNGLVKLDGKVEKSIAGLVSIKIGVAGFIDFPAEQFSFDGGGEGCFVGECIAKVDSTVSSRGIAACGKVLVVPIPGLAYRWGEPIWTAIKFFGCDAEGYKVAAPANPARVGGGRARAAQAGSAVEVRPGAPSISLAARGSGGVPDVELVDPSGKVVARTPADGKPASGADWGAAVSSTENAVYFGIERPAAGRWSLRPVAGSPAVAQIASANGLPPASVKAAVQRGKGRVRILAYRVRPQRGQRVIFVERSGTVADVIGTATKAKGTLRFSPADGAAGTRTIEAIVEQDGLVRETKKVARYRAPGPVKPGQARGLRIRRRGSNATVTWRPAADASRYKVELTVDDGRRQLFFVSKGARRLVIPQVLARTRGSVRVIGLRPDMREGKAAKLTIKPKPKPKPKKRKRRR